MIDQSKWIKLTLAQQLGNIGSEISRARHWQEKKDASSAREALERAIGLLDQTLNDARHRRRLRELARLREVVCDWYSERGEYNCPPQTLEEYCLALSL